MELNKYIFENTNISFLLGSGASVPLLGTLANIENWLTELERDTLEKSKKDKLKAIFYKKYFEIAMENNIFLIEPINGYSYKKLNFKKYCFQIFNDFIQYRQTINYKFYKLKIAKRNYKNFFQLINKLIYLRK